MKAWVNTEAAHKKGNAQNLGNVLLNGAPSLAFLLDSPTVTDLQTKIVLSVFTGVAALITASITGTLASKITNVMPLMRQYRAKNPGLTLADVDMSDPAAKRIAKGALISMAASVAGLVVGYEASHYFAIKYAQQHLPIHQVSPARGSKFPHINCASSIALKP